MRFLLSSFAALWLCLFASAAHSAEVRILPELSNNSLTSIAIVGEITKGDASELLTLLPANGDAVVFLASPGGDADEGLLVAKTIFKIGAATAVSDNFECYSACALIWVSGRTRFLSDTARVGFHAAYNQQGVSGGANALFGKFYGQLGLSDRAVRYLTSAPPNDFNYVTLDTAALLDIPVVPWQSVVSAPPPVPEQQVQSPAPQRSPTFDFLVNRDIFGFDIEEGQKADSASICNERCATKNKCKAYTFNTVNQLCHLKSGGKEVMWNKNAVSGFSPSVRSDFRFLKIAITSSTKLGGTTYDQITGTSLEKCATLCDDDKRCSGFQFEQRPSGTCTLKTGLLKRVKKPRLTAGVKTAD
jgi:hypothetical protein